MDLLNLETPEPTPPHDCRGTFLIENPYFNADPNFTMTHNFKPNYYSIYNPHLGRNVTLSYLVTHLDAMSLQIAKDMIDRSKVAINSEGYTWFIDADPTPGQGGSIILSQTTVENIFETLGINNRKIDGTEIVYTDFPSPLISYSSNGTHTTVGSNHFFNEDYIQSQLTFNYTPGAIINTAESFNVTTLGTDPPVRRAEQGQITEFFKMGGTVGVGQAVHGSSGGIIIQNDILLPSYALGYTFVEAAYLGMNNLTDNRIVVGDPLTRIFNYTEQTLSGTNTLTSGDYKTKYVVPDGSTLIIPSGADVTFSRNACL